MSDRKVISFYQACSARSELTLVSSLINYPYKVRRLAAHFAQGCENLLQVRFYTAADSNAPSSGTPGDVGLLEESGHVGFVAGDGQTVDVQHTVQVAERGTYLKVYATNGDYYAHALNAQIEIEPTDEEVV